MKKIIRLISGFTACIMMICVVAFSAFAADVTYEGTSGKFVFSANGQKTPTDLFENFKNVMPGDKLTQKILIKNDISNDVKIKLYIKSLGAGEEYKELLSQLNLTVQQDGNSELFKAPASEKSTLEDWVYLGTFYSGAEINLDVDLEVPLSLDDRYQETLGELTWCFKVDELPVEKDDPVPPDTGDRSLILPIFFGILAVIGIVICIIFFGKKKDKRD